MILNYTPYLSCFYSLLLINGIYNLSFKFSKQSGSLLKIKNLFFITILNFFIIISLLSLVTFYISLYFHINQNLIKVISFLIILIGFYKPNYIYKLIHLFNVSDYKKKIIYIILFFYFLLSMSPITDPDSLDYHIAIPQYMISFGDKQFQEYWFTSQLSGIGETFIIYGLAIGALNLSQMLQFFSLLFLILIINNFNYDKLKIVSEKVLFVSLCILTIPVFIFLVTTSKPQLFPIVCNFLALILTFLYLPFQEKKTQLICFSFIIFILFTTTQIKFFFFFSSGLIFLFAVYQLLKKKIFVETILIVLILFSAIILPREIFEYVNYNPNILYNFFNAHTDLFSSIEYNDTLKTNTGNSKLFPIWLFIPNSASQITYTIGIGALYFLFLINFKLILSKKVLLISLSYLVFGMILGQPVGRFFLEPFIWLLFFSLFSSKIYKNIFFKSFEKFLIFYSLIFMVMLSYFSINLFKANFGNKYYEEVLEKNADGYTLYKWANEVLPDDAILISTHRSHALFKNRVISYEFRNFSNSYVSSGKKYYLKSIINQKPTHILYSSQNLDNNIDLLKNCRGKLIAKKKDVYEKVGRNPFTKKEKFDGYIFKLDLKKLNNC